MAEALASAERMGSEPIEAEDLDTAQTALSRQLYYMLVMVLTGDASKLVRACEKGNGFETLSLIHISEPTRR
eukprot:5265272-Lingulodinium_polyedra.AAC.1